MLRYRVRVGFHGIAVSATIQGRSEVTGIEIRYLSINGTLLFLLDRMRMSPFLVRGVYIGQSPRMPVANRNGPGLARVRARCCLYSL